MPRTARFVLPGYPHHVTQRGNRRQQTFFNDEDYALYLDLLQSACTQFDVACWAYCLMPNHVHLILEPHDQTGLGAALKRTHQSYTRHINAREGWSGCLWQGRFGSSAMDEAHALIAVRYVELNPVKAKLCQQARDWPWSSARAHLTGEPDPLLSAVPFLERIPDWDAYLYQGLDPAIEARIGYITGTGYPMGTDDWISALETKSGRDLRPKPRGRPLKEATE